MSVPAKVSPVLVVVTEFEWAEFEIEAAFAAEHIPIHCCDASGLEAKEWAAVLEEARPAVLVGGWALPLFPDGFLENAGCSLRCLCYLTGSVRRLIPRSFLERGGLISNWGDAAAPMVAEHALLLLLAALRRLPEWGPLMQRPIAEQTAHPMMISTRTLHGRTVAMHGFGQIARQLIKLLQPFGVRVRAFSEGVPPNYIHAHGAEPVPSLEELFADADTLVEVEALTPRTRGSVSGSILDRLAPQAIFVNVGRGAVIDEAALIARASRGRIQLALDVLAEEPLPLGSPLRDIKDALISPHIGGPTHDQLPKFGRQAAANVRRYLAGEPLQQAVTLEIYDRST